MTLRITVTPSFPADVIKLFKHEICLVFAAYKQVRKMLALPASQLDVVLPDDFEAAVHQ